MASKLTKSNQDFSRKVLKWFKVYGRTDLPWQKNPTPYRVWISEIMLQQTQVAAVIPYYQRFMHHFPNLKQLAQATADEVLHYWSGLGYYARARNLHQTAKTIRSQYAGRFPLEIDQLIALPGIGRSTAGAILALSKQQRHPILDGNVKRVLSRYHAIDGWPEGREAKSQLWELAEQSTPTTQLRNYTQAMMDLGATVCRRTKPNCSGCPVKDNCKALKLNRVSEIPFPKPKRDQPVRHTKMLILLNKNKHILLLKRPPTGIWGGLWSFPECEPAIDVKQWCQQQFSLTTDGILPLEKIRHSFSHFHLSITPVKVNVLTYQQRVMEEDKFLWYNRQGKQKLGMAAPVQKILSKL